MRKKEGDLRSLAQYPRWIEAEFLMFPFGRKCPLVRLDTKRKERERKEKGKERKGKERKEKKKRKINEKHLTL